MASTAELVGRQFGRISVTRKIPGGRCDQWRFECVCECGTIMQLRASYLLGGRKKSCGCFRRDRAGQLFKTHGLSKTMAYCMFYDARKRAFARGLPFDIEPSDIIIPTTCPVLGIPLRADGHKDYRPSLDRIYPALGYVRDNIRVISFRANRIKADATADELRLVLRYVEGTP